MVDIATDASLKPASHPKPLRVGLDIGSTTVKAVVLDQSDSLGDTLFSDYRRHHANVRATVAGLLVDIHKKLVDLGRGDEPIRLSITGSGGLALADNLHVPFIQEVIAETEAIDKEYPQADVIIELGGEDAKITYLNNAGTVRAQVVPARSLTRCPRCLTLTPQALTRWPRATRTCIRSLLVVVCSPKPICSR